MATPAVPLMHQTLCLGNKTRTARRERLGSRTSVDSLNVHQAGSPPSLADLIADRISAAHHMSTDWWGITRIYDDMSTKENNKGEKRRRIGGAGQGRDDAWQRRAGRGTGPGPWLLHARIESAQTFHSVQRKLQFEIWKQVKLC